MSSDLQAQIQDLQGQLKSLDQAWQAKKTNETPSQAQNRLKTYKMILYAAWAVLLVVSIPAAVSGDSWVLLLSAPAAYFFFNVYKTQERIQADYPKAAAQYQKQRQNLLQKIEQLQNQLEA